MVAEVNDTNGHTVPAATREAARAMLWQATLDLGLRQPGQAPPFKVEWKSAAEMPEAMGQARGLTDRIFLRSDLTPEEAAVTMAHECRHLWQYENGQLAALDALITPAERERAEADAYAYEAKAMRSFTMPSPAPEPDPMDNTVAMLTDLLNTLKAMNAHEHRTR